MAYKISIQLCMSYLLSNWTGLLAFAKWISTNGLAFINKTCCNLTKTIAIAIILILRLAQLDCWISFSNMIMSESFYWYTHWILQKLRLILIHLVQSLIRVLPLQNSLRNCVYILIVKFVKNIYINMVTLLYNLVDSQLYKYVANLPAVLILSIIIIVFGITDTKVVEVTKKSSSSKLSLLIEATKYVIFGRSNDSLYN